MTIQEKIKKNWSLIFVFLFMLVCLIYVLIMGENIYMYVWDNLDGGVAQLKMLGDNHLFFAWNEEVPYLGGIPRKYVWFSEFELYNLLYAVLPAFAAYVASFFFSIIISVLGSIYLGKCVLKESYEKYKHIIVISALIFGMLPVYPLLRFAFASQPLFLGLMYNYYHKPSIKLGVCIFLYPVLSDMSRIGIFLCGYTLLFFIIEAIKTKKPKWHMLLAVVILAVGYFCVEWRLVYMTFTDVAMSRDEYVLPTYGFNTALAAAKSTFKNGQVHAGDFHKYFVLPVCCIGFLVINIKHLVKKQFKVIFQDKYNWFFVLIIFNCFIQFIDYWEGTKSILATIPVISGLSLYRAIWLNAFLWYLEFTIVVAKVYDLIKEKAYALSAIALAVLLIGPMGTSYFNDLSYNFKFIPHYLKYNEGYTTLFSFKEYYSEDLFEEILNDIDYQGEYSLAYCLEPAVLEYNGIKTLDGNSNCYPLEYKRKWEKLIAPVLEIRTDYAETFANKGIYAFAYSPDIDHEATKDIGITESELLINMDVLQEMGGKYIFSRVKISNAEELGLELDNIYTDENSPYTIYLYEY